MKTAWNISHCWRYSRLLTLHLSRVALNPPKTVHLTEIVCFNPEDSETLEVLDYFQRSEIQNVTIKPHPMKKERLFRRGIGRHELALQSQADAVFFSDVDYLLDGPTLDAAVAEMFTHSEPKLFFPRFVEQSKDHASGDFEINAVRKVGIYGINPDLYETARLPRAIGGCQWIFGETAREKGYLPEGSRWLAEEDAWRRTRCDCIARWHWGLPSVGLAVRGVHRVRHGQRGRENPETKN